MIIENRNKMFKKTIILLSLVVSGLTLNAQNVFQERHNHADTIQQQGKHHIGWLRSHIMDNWIIGLQGGGQLYCGYEDFKGPLGSHLTGNVEGYLGRWIFPMMGLRAVGGYGTDRKSVV